MMNREIPLAPRDDIAREHFAGENARADRRLSSF